MSISKVELKELKEELLSGNSILTSNVDVIKDLKVKLQVSLGETELKVDELMSLEEGSVVKINRSVNAPLDVYINNKLVARGLMVVVDDDFGLQITEII
jgi:flagellar motor switch protein FliN